MKMSRKLVAVGALGLALAGPALADDNPYSHFGQRADTQRDRITLGLQRGLLTPEEARSLYQDQRELARMHWYFTEDGYLSASERARLEQAFNEESGRIFELKHNLYRQLPGWYRTYGTYDDQEPYGAYRHYGYDRSPPYQHTQEAMIWSQ